MLRAGSCQVVPLKLGPSLGAANAPEVMLKIMARAIAVLVNMGGISCLKSITPSWCVRTMGRFDRKICEVVHISRLFSGGTEGARGQGAVTSARGCPDPPRAGTGPRPRR